MSFPSRLEWLISATSDLLPGGVSRVAHIGLAATLVVASRSAEMALEVDMKVVDRDAVETFEAIGRTLGAILDEGKVERTPRINQLLEDLSALTVYALGTRKYRQGAQH